MLISLRVLHSSITTVCAAGRCVRMCNFNLKCVVDIPARLSLSGDLVLELLDTHMLACGMSH